MEEFKGDKRTKAYKEWKAKFDKDNENKSKGLGDTVAKITKATGIKKVVKFIAGEDCGCDARKAKLNELFRYNTQVINFSSAFRNCRALTNIPTFQYNLSVTTFANIFNMSSTTNGSSNWGTVEALWDREPEPLGINAFNNCTGITNYAVIPINWK